MSTDIVYPLLIGAGCLLIVIVVHLLTRPKPSRSDIKLPEGSNSSASSANITDLGQWHQTHEASVLSFLDLHDPAPDFDTAADEITSALEVAVETHPAPEMRAELAALRAAAEAMTLARSRSDAEAVERHREVYDTYRDAWLERLWQFPVDSERVGRTRKREIEAG